VERSGGVQGIGKWIGGGHVNLKGAKNPLTGDGERQARRVALNSGPGYPVRKKT